MVAGRSVLEQIAGQNVEVAGSLTQRWDVQLDDAQAVEQVLAKPA